MVNVIAHLLAAALSFLPTADEPLWWCYPDVGGMTCYLANERPTDAAPVWVGLEANLPGTERPVDPAVDAQLDFAYALNHHGPNHWPRHAPVVELP